MKAKYDAEVDVLTIRWSDSAIAESDEDKPGVIVDYDENGNIVGVEILQASKAIENLASIAAKTFPTVPIAPLDESDLEEVGENRAETIDQK